MQINWKVRLKNKTFWLALIPAVLLLIQQVCGIFGVALEITWMTDQLLSIISTVFVIMTLLGVVNDPTTAGMGDSAQAMGYEKPKE